MDNCIRYEKLNSDIIVIIFFKGTLFYYRLLDRSKRRRKILYVERRIVPPFFLSFFFLSEIAAMHEKDFEAALWPFLRCSGQRTFSPG